MLGHQSWFVCGRPDDFGSGEEIAGFSLSLVLSLLAFSTMSSGSVMSTPPSGSIPAEDTVAPTEAYARPISSASRVTVPVPLLVLVLELVLVAPAARAIASVLHGNSGYAHRTSDVSSRARGSRTKRPTTSP